MPVGPLWVPTAAGRRQEGGSEVTVAPLSPEAIGVASPTLDAQPPFLHITTLFSPKRVFVSG